MIDYTEIITLEPGKRSGKPLRITVYDVLSYLAAGMTYDEILSDFPMLTLDDILACLSYVADQTDKIPYTEYFPIPSPPSTRRYVPVV
jgi:uncharacterized protein (DUF433 family)